MREAGIALCSLLSLCSPLVLPVSTDGNINDLPFLFFLFYLFIIGFRLPFVAGVGGVLFLVFAFFFFRWHRFMGRTGSFLLFFSFFILFFSHSTRMAGNKYALLRGFEVDEGDLLQTNPESSDGP